MSLLVSNVTFGYSLGLSVISKIDLEAGPGDTVCILGASGSGKSTLLKVIAGLLPARSNHHLTGSIFFGGKPVEDLKTAGELSFMFQDHCLMPNLTVIGNVEFPVRALKRSFNTTVEETIHMVGLSNALYKFPKELSGGMKARTALARSFITQPRLLLLDEPFSSLDQGWRYDLYKELKILQKRDSTIVVMVTHDIDEALELADMIYVISFEGKLLGVLENKPTELLLNRELLKELITSDHQLAIKR